MDYRSILTGRVFMSTRYQLQRLRLSNTVGENSLGDPIPEIAGGRSVFPWQQKPSVLKRAHEDNGAFGPDRICSAVVRDRSSDLLQLYFFELGHQFLTYPLNEALPLVRKPFLLQLTLLLHHPQTQRQKDAARKENRDQEQQALPPRGI
jgi:hypothetical protein